MKKFKDLKNKTNVKLITIVSLTILLWLNIGVDPHFLKFFFQQNFTNNIRSVAPFIVIIVSSYLIYKSTADIEKKNYLIIFFLYLFSQTLGFFFFNHNQSFFYTNYVVFQSLALLFYLIYLYNEKNIVIKTAITSSFLILLVIGFYFFTKNFLYWYDVTTPNQTMYSTDYSNNAILLDTAVPRSTGVARMASVLFIIFFSVFCCLKKNFFFKFFLIILNIFLLSLIILLQSRFSIYGLVITLFVLLFFIKDKKKNIAVVFLIIFISNIGALYLQDKKTYNHEKYVLGQVLFLSEKSDYLSGISKPQLRKLFNDLQKTRTLNSADEKKAIEEIKTEIKNFHSNNKSLKNEFDFEINANQTHNRSFKSLVEEYKKNKNLHNESVSDQIGNNCFFYESKINFLTSGRVCHWYILIFKEKISFFGNGANAERKIIKWGASSAIVYSIFSSGFFGLIFIFWIYFIILKKIVEFKNTKLSTLNLSSFGICIFISIRSLVENSFSIWGLDQILFFSCLIFLMNSDNNQISKSLK